jgi:hypothetical protein
MLFLLPIIRSAKSVGRRPAQRDAPQARNAEPDQRERIAWRDESHPTMDRASGTNNGTDTSTATRLGSKH